MKPRLKESAQNKSFLIRSEDLAIVTFQPPAMTIRKITGIARHSEPSEIAEWEIPARELRYEHEFFTMDEKQQQLLRSTIAALALVHDKIIPTKPFDELSYELPFRLIVTYSVYEQVRVTYPLPRAYFVDAGIALSEFQELNQLLLQFVTIFPKRLAKRSSLELKKLLIS